MTTVRPAAYGRPTSFLYGPFHAALHQWKFTTSDAYPTWKLQRTEIGAAGEVVQSTFSRYHSYEIGMHAMLEALRDAVYTDLEDP